MPPNRATLELFAALDRSSPAPLRAQLEDAVCEAITGGGLPPGMGLPGGMPKLPGGLPGRGGFPFGKR